MKGRVLIVIVCVMAAANTASADRYMYWTTGRSILRASPDGSNRETIVSIGNLGPRGIDFDLGSGLMYWTNLRSIQRSNIDGSNMETLIKKTDGWSTGLRLDIYGGKMYWAETTRDKILRANLDGTEVEDFITGLEFTDSISVGLAIDSDHRKIYWSEVGVPNTSTGRIRRANLDGSGIEDIASELNYPWGIDLDVQNDHVYWIADDAIYRSSIDGENVETVIDGLTAPRFLDIDVVEEQIYWTDVAGGGTIFKADLYSWNVETVVNNAVPVRVMIIPEPTTVLLLGLGGLVLARRRR